MRRVLIVLGVMASLTFQAQGQVPDFSSFSGIVEKFTNELAGNLPLAAAVGANWSDAYIGQVFPSVPPHFGAGLTVGSAFIAKDSLKSFTQTFGTNLPELLEGIGIPIPALVLDARVGGVILPFDVGIKVGFLPEFLTGLYKELGNAEYLSVGADVRYALLQENVVLPDLSIGLGYTYMSGSFRVPIDQVISIDNVPYLVGGTPNPDGKLSFADPNLGVNFSTSVIDLKAQISKDLLLILTPYFGLGASLAVSEAGAGWYSTLTLKDSSNTTIATGQQAANYIKDGAAYYGVNMPDLSSDGISALSPANGWGFRLYGGTSINLFILRLDLKGMYNITTGNLGFDVGVRAQL